jgi:hypothetical protein
MRTVVGGKRNNTMTDAIQADAQSSPEARPEPNHTASFGTAFLGFMITTTLTTSIMVLLGGGL